MNLSLKRSLRFGGLGLLFAAGSLSVCGETNFKAKGSFPTTVYSDEAFPDGIRATEIDEDSKGVIYVGSNKGLHSFDGTRWRHYEGPRVSTLAVGPNDQVYVATIGDVGKWKKNEMGQLQFHSLRPLFGSVGHRNTSGFRDVTRVGDSVYFTRTLGVFRVTPETPGKESVQVFSHSELSEPLKFRRVRPHPSGVLVQLEAMDDFYDLKIGWIRDDGIEIEEVHEDPNTVADHIVDINVFPSGKLFLTGSSQLHFIDERGFRRQLNTGIESSAVMFKRAAALLDGRMAVASNHSTGDVFFVDESGSVSRYEAGSSEPRNIYCDHMGRLWLSDWGKVHRIDLPTGLLSWTTPGNGLIHDVALFKNALVAATTRGLFFARTDESNGLPLDGFEPLGDAQPWRTLAAAGNQLFVGGAGYLGIVRDLENPPELVDTRYFFDIFADSERVLITTDRGLDVYRPISGVWKRVNRIENKKPLVRLTVDNHGHAWVATLGKNEEALVVQIDPEREGNAAFLSSHEVRGNGIPCFSHGEVFYFGKSFSGTGRFDRAQGCFVNEHIDHGLPAQTDLHSVTDVSMGANGEDILVAASPRAIRMKGGVTGEAEPIISYAGGPALQCIAEDSHGNVWAGSGNLILCAIPKTSRSVRPQIRLGDSYYQGDVKDFVQFANKEALGYTTKVLTIEYSVPVALQPEKTEYQVRLAGLDDSWSGWSREAEVDFAALREGDYRLEVRARTIENPHIEPMSLAFSVSPPWQRHPLFIASMMALMILVAAAMSGGLAYGYSNRRRVKEREMMLQELSDVNTNLRVARDDFEHFSYAVAHDLRAPLRNLSLLCELIEMDRDGRDGRKIAETLMDEVNRLDDYTSGILSFAWAGKSPDEAKPVEIHALARLIFDSLNEDVDLEFYGEEITVLADQNLLTLVIQNLLTNAIKATRKVDQRGKISVTARPLPEAWEISVRDNGCGIPETQHGLIFQLFERSIWSEDADGSTGIGLAVVKRIVESWGGEIRVDAAPGKGATFTFTIPGGERD